MRIVQNTFTPDTCDKPGCRIVFSFDSDLPGDQVESSYQLVRIENKCTAHTALTDQQVYDTAWHTENKLKNNVHATIMQNNSALTETVVDESGASILQFKSGIEYDWSFDQNRVLNVNMKGVTQQQKNSIKSALQSQFGQSVKVI